MTYGQKEFEVKIKMVQEQQLQLKMKFLLGYNLTRFYLVRGELTFRGGGGEGIYKNLVGWSLLGGFF